MSETKNDLPLVNPDLTPLSRLGEFALIKRLTADFKNIQPSTIRGIGDDAAVIDKSDSCSIITTDMLVENVHFDLVYTPVKHLGYKAVTVNLSDVYAMNATPKQITVSIAVSNKFTIEALEELYSGIRAACKTYEVDLVGGDTTSSHSGLIISVTAIGVAKKEDVVYRNTASKNDLLCVSGSLGAAYLGLLVLQREKQVYKENPEMHPILEGYEYVLQRQLRPEARRDIIQLLGEIKIKPTAMIDVSDGLSSELLHICRGSGLGCQIYEERIPIDRRALGVAKEFNLSTATCALNGGEDYELLFALSLADYDKIKDNPIITTIGHLTTAAEGCNLIAQNGTRHELKAQGWDALGGD